MAPHIANLPTGWYLTSTSRRNLHVDTNDKLPTRATFRFGINRSSANKRMRYIEGTQIDPNECIFCVPDLNDDVVELGERVPDAESPQKTQ